METAFSTRFSVDLFLGWALGANDAANVFGTAVGSRMVRFSTAAIICSVFVLLGAVMSGAGASETLGKLGAINACPVRSWLLWRRDSGLPHDQSRITRSGDCRRHYWLELILWYADRH